MSFWKDKVVIITGSSQGIGKEMALQAGKAGARIVLNGRKAEKLEAVHEEFKKAGIVSFVIQGDVSVPDDCQRLIDQTIEHFGRIDALVNNAGLSTTQQPFERTAPDIFAKIIQVNLLGSIYTSHYAIPHLQESQGSILFVGSEAGIHGLPHYSAYSASKMALRSLAQSLRIELHETGIHIGLAYVGFTENDPNKEVYTIDGDIVPISNRSPFKPMPRQQTARRLLKMIENRNRTRIFSPLGNLLHKVNNVSPKLVRRILTGNLKKGKPS
jgi:short-subunit dehydrogenase